MSALKSPALVKKERRKKSATGCKVKAKKQNKTTLISSHTFPLNCVTGQEQQLVFLNKSLCVKKKKGGVAVWLSLTYTEVAVDRLKQLPPPAPLRIRQASTSLAP